MGTCPSLRSSTRPALCRLRELTSSPRPSPVQRHSRTRLSSPRSHREKPISAVSEGAVEGVRMVAWAGGNWALPAGKEIERTCSLFSLPGRDLYLRQLLSSQQPEGNRLPDDLVCQQPMEVVDVGHWFPISFQQNVPYGDSASLGRCACFDRPDQQCPVLSHLWPGG